jgi:cyclopropane-fatty-acyl-phospholipid synthase
MGYTHAAEPLGRAARFLRARVGRKLPAELPSAFAVRLRSGQTVTFGEGAARATFVIRRLRGLWALLSMDATRIAEAYCDGALDIDGDIESLLALRSAFTDRHPLTSLWRFIRPRLFGQIKSDVRWISEHYEHHPDFYLSFLDRAHRCYSQAIFATDDEPLETAMRRKLDFAIAAVGAKPGDRVLDIGGGWGAFLEYGGQHDLQVTSLTISADSEKFLRGLIARQQLPCQVRREHLFTHQVQQPYDAIVNLGVTEHLPDYRRTLAKYRELLKPGGRVYLDASASRERYDLSAFLLRHIYPGNGSLLCLADYLEAVKQTPFKLLELYDDRHSYALTSLHWARNFDMHAEEIVRRWGAPLYRAFRVYLWGCADGFERDVLQAHRLVLELNESPVVSR